MVKIGVVGASGFAGKLAVELLHPGETQVRAIERSPVPHLV